MPRFEVISEYKPSGDQPEAIAALAQGVELGLEEQTLLGKAYRLKNGILEQVTRDGDALDMRKLY